MKTTELYIEQVLIGLLIIAIAALPWVPELIPKLASVSTAAAIAEGSVLLGLAFWLGIPFDRFADTLSERLERHNRLQFALNNAIGEKLPVPTQESLGTRLDKDIYAEDRLRLKGLRNDEAVVNWIEYHRSRIRLARALAVYGPALTFSMTLGVSRSLKEIPHSVSWLWLSSVAAGYFVWAILASPPKVVRDKLGNSRVLRAVFSKEVPRTDKAQFIEYAKKWERVENDHFTKGNYADPLLWVYEWRILAIPLLLFVWAISLGVENGTTTASVAWIGAVLSVISAWSWWRISFTYRSYLRDLDPTSSDRRSCSL